MPRIRSTIAIPSLGSLDRSSGRIGQQLAQGLREAIARGDLKPGERLPSTRSLGDSLGLARGTIIEAFEQLKAEGYLVSLPRAGTAVVGILQHDTVIRGVENAPSPASRPIQLSAKAERFAAIAYTLEPQRGVPFAIAHPAGAVAPDETWRRLGNRIRGMRAAAPTGYIDPRGLPALRTTISDYVRKARAVRCRPEQVVITGGTQQGLFLSATVLSDAGDAVWIEDPAYPGISTLLSAFDVSVCRIPVDANGIDVDRGIDLCPNARVAFVTPSHQYPIGMPMSMARRLAILRWAQDNEAWIVEDDYDSELRYSGHPFPSLQGLDPSRVIYLGTMSKVMFSSMRLGYAIVPEPLIDSFAGARALIDRHSPTADQHVLAAFMNEGHFEAHIRRIRGVYAERRAALIKAIEQHFPSWVTLQPSDQGMHLVLWLPDGLDDVSFAAECLAAEIVVRPISPMYSAREKRHGLMLGFGGFSISQLETEALRLANMLKTRHG